MDRHFKLVCYMKFYCVKINKLLFGSLINICDIPWSVSDQQAFCITMINLLPVADNNFSNETKWQNMCQKMQYCAICYPFVIFICINEFDWNYEKPGHKVNIFVWNSAVFLQFWALKISFFVRNITHESCIKVGILVCGWCQAICSQSKVLIKTFPRWLPHTPFLLMYLSMYWKAFIQYSLNLKGNSHPAPKSYGWPAHPTIIWLVYLNGHDQQIASKSNWLDS